MTPRAHPAKLWIVGAGRTHGEAIELVPVASSVFGGSYRMKIREFSMEDYAEVYRLWHRSGLNLVPSDQPDEIEKKLARDPELFLVAEDEAGLIVGCVIGAWDGRRAWIYHICTDPDCQRLGVGAMLMEELEKRLIALGAIKINLLVRKQNIKGKQFYRKLGYDLQEEFDLMGKRFF